MAKPKKNSAGENDPSGKYDIILADPPWQFQVWNRDTGSGRSAESHYSTMSISDLCTLDLPAAKNCALFLWACWPTLPEALTLIDAWGFKYKTIAWVWVKLNKLKPTYFTGMGYYTRANTEPCLLAIRGRMPVAAHNVLSVIASPVRRHSQKPDEQYEKIEKLYPTGQRLEMFARSHRPGWDVWGNEVESSVELMAQHSTKQSQFGPDDNEDENDD